MGILEIPDTLDLAEEAEARLYNEVRPPETIDFDTPLSRYLADPADPHPFGAKSAQES